jgi:tetratricopeptide (TPR) repeat protein
VSDVVSFKYKAFLSYSHRDKARGEWLHRALENYKIDKDLIGRETPAGPVPKTLRPIFRDRDDFAAGHSLTEQTLAALGAAQFLVVVCTPHAAKSEYVNEEIRRFKAMGRAERVIAIIVDGEPGDAQRECFPPALRVKVGADGALTGEREEPIAADARRDGDGKRLAVQKVVAALLDVPFDDLRKRDAIADSRRIKIVAAGAAVFAVIAMAAGYFIWHANDQARRETALVAEQQRRDDEQKQRDEEHRQQLAALQAEYRGLAEKLLGASTAQAAPGQVQAVGAAVAATVQGAAEGDDRLKRALALLDAKKIEEASVLLRAVAEDKERAAKSSGREAATAYRNLGAIAGLGDPKRARDAYLKAVELDPSDVSSMLWVGWIEKERGHLDEAARHLNRVLSLATGDDTVRHRYWARLSVGDIRVARGDLNAAMADYRAAAAIVDRLPKADLNNAGWQRDLSVSYARIGDVQVAQGNLSEALTSFRDSLAIADRLAKADPGNAEWQRDLSVSFNKVGDVLVAQGNLSEALTSFRDSLAIRDRLAKADPGNAGWQRDLSVSFNRVGDVLVAQGNLSEALKSYQASHDIFDRLAKADPGNAGWQRDLSVSYDRVGDVQVKQGNLPEALKSFRDSLAIRDRLAKADPGNAEWQRDLSVSHSKIGGLLMKQEKPSEALVHYRADLSIAEKLAAMDTSNTGWQRDLVISHRQVLAALRKVGVGKLTTEQSRWLRESEAKLAELTKQ